MALGLIALFLFGCRGNPPPAPLCPVVAGEPTIPEPLVGSQLDQGKLGIHLLLDDGRQAWPAATWPVHLACARQAVGEWGYVTQLVRLDDLEPARWQRFMDLAAEWHLTPILRLATTFDTASGSWSAPPADAAGRYQAVAARYARFVAALHWPTAGHLVIVGNEPNHGNEWGGRPDPAAYARFLADTADALHATDPAARVLNAPFDAYTPHSGGQPFPDGFVYLDEETFLDEMVAAVPDVFTRLDGWASHAYPAGPFSEGPWQQSFQIDWLNNATNPWHVPPPPGIYNRGVNGYEWELFKLATYGLPPLPVYITETGWRHAETEEARSPDSGAALPDAETAAVYLDLALRGNSGRYPELPEEGWTPWLADPRVVAITFFALDGHPAW